MRIGVALAIGLLLGFERGWNVRDYADGSRIAGIRTFGVVGLYGGTVGLIAALHGPWVFASGVLALGALISIAHFRSPRSDRDQSITTLAALLVDFALAALAGYGEITTAGAAAVVAVALLGVKPELHGFLRRIRREELLATIRLLLISIVVLPILPDRAFGPFDAINPQRLWWMVVLVAAVSYCGYVAVRVAGVRRGIVLTALFGGLSSSTAVALNLSRLARDKALSLPILAGGTVTASAVMFPRTLLVAGVVAPALVPLLACMLLPAGAVALFGAWLLFRRHDSNAATEPEAERFATQNPLDLVMALKFGALLAVIMLAARAAAAVLGNEAVYAVAAVSGIADVDAITLSVADGSADGAFASRVATAAIGAAVTVNTLVKVGLVGVIAGLRAGIAVGTPLVAGLAAGGIGLWVGLR